jgi:hypothetical protein
MSVLGPGFRLLRWKIQLQRYGYGLIYKPRAQNWNADTLSRINAIGGWGEDCNPETINENAKAEILREYHDSILGVHLPSLKTKHKLSA